MHDELKTIDDVMGWLEMDGGIKVDEKGAYVTRAKWKDSVYTGPPMLLDWDEDNPLKLYLQKFMLESMIIRFLKDGKAEEFSPITPAFTEHVQRLDKGYSNHITNPNDTSYCFKSILMMKIERNDAGDVRYDAEIIKGDLEDVLKATKPEEEPVRDEIRTFDNVMGWLETNGYVKFDRTPNGDLPYVAHARLIKGHVTDKGIDGVDITRYTGPPMLLDGTEYMPYKLYIPSSDLESLAKRFLKEGKAEQTFSFDFRMERGADAGSGYTNHLSDFDVGQYHGFVDMRLERNKTGDIVYYADIRGNINWA